jgi:hypothetical protein
MFQYKCTMIKGNKIANFKNQLSILSCQFLFTMSFILLLQTEEFKVCKSVLHRTIQINHQPDATIFQFIILTFIYSSTCVGRSPTHHQDLNDCISSLRLYLRMVVTVVLCSWSGRLIGPTTNAAQLSPRYESKTRGC